MRKLLWLLTAVAILVVAGASAWRLLRVSEMARIGAGYTAQQTCACMFISRRAPESCHMDLEPMARWLIQAKPGAGEVTASAFGLARATSRYEQGFGCALKD